MSKIIGGGNNFNRRNVNQDGTLKLSLADYVEFRLFDKDLEGMTDHFLDWVKDESYFKNYDNWEIVKPTDMLIRVYRYESLSNSPILGPDGEAMKKLKILPFGKIIKVGSEVERWAPGDIVSLPESIGDVVVSEMWLMWNKRMAVEKPTPEIPEPVRLAGLIETWRRDTKFTADKLNPCQDDEYTFLRRETEFSVKYNPK